MDQDSRVAESRERALSSEPSSTRPNPFDDLSAPKRRRTSLSGSRSTSVETLPSQADVVVASDANGMKLDTPEPVLPSTPVRSPPPTEPVSSKVTINLRNAESLEATPSSTMSPTPARRRSDDTKVSVEASEVDMAQPGPAEDTSSSSSNLDSPEEPAIALDDFEDSLDFSAVEPQNALLGDRRAANFGAAMMAFPYRLHGESHHETLYRLTNHFRQQSANIEEALASLHAWLERYLACASTDLYPMVIEVFQENRPFWISLPELFQLICSRQGYMKIRELRDLVLQLLALYGKLTAFLLNIDLITLKQVATTEGSELDLMSPPFTRALSNITARDGGLYANDHGGDGSQDLVDPLDAFQSSPWGSLSALVGFAELQTSMLHRFPKKSMDYLAATSMLAGSIVQESHHKHSDVAGSQADFSAYVLERSRKNLAWGQRYFDIVSSALAVVIEKSINHLVPDNALAITMHLTNIIRQSLQGSHIAAIETVEKYRQAHPNVSPLLTHEVVSLEWRFEVLCKLIRSRQMQLRVTAAQQMSDELVALWKKYSDQDQQYEDAPLHQEYLRYLSDYVVRLGIVDYVLGPTCHPEITQGSSNLVGFLAVTNTYTSSQTDLLWQTFTSTQDPRISEALARMMSRILHLLQPDSLSYLVHKFHVVPIDSFTPVMRELFDSVTENLINKTHYSPLPLYEVCVRLLRESSVYGAESCVAYPDIQHFALVKFKKLLQPGMSQAARLAITTSCLQDIAAGSPTSSGSLQVLGILAAAPPAIAALVDENHLTRLLVNELESTVKAAEVVGFAPVYANPVVGQARRKFISIIIMHHGSTIDTDLGPRLWDLLVGNGATCYDDRRVAWEDLNQALKKTGLKNPFLDACLREYLPSLSPSWYCPGSLVFVREVLLPLANDPNGIVFDDADSLKSAGVELLWQMILSAPDQTIEEGAIRTLVNDIYVDSSCILSYPLHRARNVHFAFVQRCLQQLKSAAHKLQAFSDGTTSGDDEPMVIVATDEQHREQDLQFTRTLKVLITLLRALQTRSHFAAPDLRSLMLQSPGAVDGDSASLKYQSFDGEEHTEVKLLDIGLNNSAASLLAKLREATGFDNYRLYYRGQPLTPSNSDICKSLGDLRIKNGLILVKKEFDTASSPVRIKPGASSLDIEILGHFKDLWEYLSMEEKLAREIYQFLISLPADDSILAAFENPATSHRDVFPLGQPFKCLYAIHALREYLSTRRLKSSVMQISAQDSQDRQKTAGDKEDALVKAVSLIVAAICDPEVTTRCQSEDLRLLLSFQLVDNFAQLLKETMDIDLVNEFLNADLLERLVTILNGAAAAKTSSLSTDLVYCSFEALLESCAKSHEFWILFRDKPMTKHMIQKLLLAEERPFVRKNFAKLVSTRSHYNNGPSGVLALDFAEFFWPLVLQLLPQAVTEPRKCEEVFSLSSQLLKKLAEGESATLDLPPYLADWGQLLLSHTPTEDIAHPDQHDIVAHGLITILFHGLMYLDAKEERVQPVPGFAMKLFSRHLFPPNDTAGPLIPQVILHPSSRNMLYETISLLVKDDRNQSLALLQGLDTLTSFHRDSQGDEQYRYDLPQLFDRATAVRSSCGYSGMRNLSNTCYLNSLFTQLFMNGDFRRFILGARSEHLESHQLLQETQALFAYLQDSRRRFIDPQTCVDRITTYEELPIDIHNQMDVDEFYSLLFDRFEAQLASDSDKKALRSIYGGQLVQQVKSKECEHISERIEPFSAIQCDIKGKANLEESLQAYVDGEIMEGDNKYKCSTCEKHVDAVKRACLKDIPDNLIFHLKRFDFNLRTLTRSKINDYFPFPTKINMQPYTIEHLSDPTGQKEPDMFELVGVLVHSGTAESGHYYSFIRERPTTADAASWVEFNDEVVTSWDSSQMENACFGGSDYRPQFDTTGVYEKVYSAYMLFYQRTSSLKKENDSLRTSGTTNVVRSRLPPDLELRVKGDNWATVQRHCLYGREHIPFVHNTLKATWGARCSDDHRKENLAMQVALGHLDQVASRAKELPDFDSLKSLIVKACQRCPLCCFAFFTYLSTHKLACRMLLLKNVDSGVRQASRQILLYSLRSIKYNYPYDYGIEDGGAGPNPNILESAAAMFAYVWDGFHQRTAAWPEYFGVMLDFAQLGLPEAGALLQADFLVKLLYAIMADQALELPPQYARLALVLSRRTAVRPPNYDNMIALLDTLMEVMDTDPEDQVETPDGRLTIALDGDAIPFTPLEINILHQEWWGRPQAGYVDVFVDKLIMLNQNAVATDSILSRLIALSDQMEQKVFNTLRAGITGQLTTQMVTPYLRAAVAYCQRSPNALNVCHLIRHVNDQCRSIIHNAEGRSFFEFLRDTYEGTRNTGESHEEVQLQSLRNLPVWVPGLLSNDLQVSLDVQNFLQEKLFKYGANPVFAEANGGAARAQAMRDTGKHVAISCLMYLRDTYIARRAQAIRAAIQPVQRVIRLCHAYFGNDEEMDGDLGAQYDNLRHSVMESLAELTVDEIEEDGSEWEQSVGSSDQMENFELLEGHS
ncbi:Uu.00g060590.m01.CDS01 [Anthostomella pinea]|uniref:Uu.00g060590.m01.CDS01 n=1 Tax=Anthostomella pinea TaxID=933095 RepID=A0AAI8YMH8_9PEZI|nr:Uu.00g060590.m01.CDS01 [Anthostomella pinea]